FCEQSLAESWASCARKTHFIRKDPLSQTLKVPASGLTRESEKVVARVCELESEGQRCLAYQRTVISNPQSSAISHIANSLSCAGRAVRSPITAGFSDKAC